MGYPSGTNAQTTSPGRISICASLAAVRPAVRRLANQVRKHHPSSTTIHIVLPSTKPSITAIHPALSSTQLLYRGASPYVPHQLPLSSNTTYYLSSTTIYIVLPSSQRCRPSSATTYPSYHTAIHQYLPYP